MKLSPRGPQGRSSRRYLPGANSSSLSGSPQRPAAVKS